MTLRLSSLLETQANGFNLVRLVAAIAVVASHSFMLVHGFDDARPLSWGPYEIGSIAVNVFFFLSGLLLSRSLEREPSLRTFAINRALRIFPALVVSGFVVGWVILPLSMGIGLDYFLDPDALLYPLVVNWQFDAAHLHSAFLTSTYPELVNAPLWTIRFELLAYFSLGLASALGLFRNRNVTLAFCIAFAIGILIVRQLPDFQELKVNTPFRLGLCFLLGVAAFQHRDSIRLDGRWAIAALAVALPLGLTPIGAPAWIAAFAYAALVLAAQTVPVLTQLTRRTDISYGLYIYAWPLQQVLMEHRWSPDALGVTLHFVWSVLLVVPVAALSWILIEQPAIRLKRGFRLKGAAPAEPAPR